MVIKLDELKWVVWREKEHVKVGTPVASNLPPWLKQHILRIVRVEEQRAKRRTENATKSAN